MEIFGAFKAQKKREARAKQELIQIELDKKLTKAGKTRDEEIAWKKECGYPDPPSVVYSIGKEGGAAVWWPEVLDVSTTTVTTTTVKPSASTSISIGNDDMSSGNQDMEQQQQELLQLQIDEELRQQHKIISWRVNRYRRESAKMPWHCKGYNDYNKLLKLQVTVDDLSNGYQYCFTVQSKNSVGYSIESTHSNPVMVDIELPSGWFRFFDDKTQRFYYANLKLRKSTWMRPELDPYFLEDTLAYNFNDNEIDVLKDIYNEYIANFNCISVDNFMGILLEVGERIPKRRVIKLFLGYAKSEESLNTWQAYMDIINHIKVKKMSSTSVFPTDPSLIIARRAVALLFNDDKEKMGDWKVEYSSIADRNYYLNKVTGETRWQMPDQIRFYIPVKLEHKLMKVFDYGHIEAFKQNFSMLDLDTSGDLSDKELKLFFDAVKLKVSASMLKKLIETVDFNGNGTIEFCEFCWMMMSLQSKEKKGVLLDIAISNAHANNAATGSIIDITNMSSSLMNNKRRSSFTPVPNPSVGTANAAASADVRNIIPPPADDVADINFSRHDNNDDDVVTATTAVDDDGNDENKSEKSYVTATSYASGSTSYSSYSTQSGGRGRKKRRQHQQHQQHQQYIATSDMNKSVGVYRENDKNHTNNDEVNKRNTSVCHLLMCCCISNAEKIQSVEVPAVQYTEDELLEQEEQAILEEEQQALSSGLVSKRQPHGPYCMCTCRQIYK